MKKFPVEFNDFEKNLIEYILRKKLSMVSFERLVGNVLACKYVIDNHIDGAYVECGVWRGGNSLIAAAMFEKYNCRRDIVLFDTYEGMTKPGDFDVSCHGVSASDELKSSPKVEDGIWCIADLNDVIFNFKKLNLLHSGVKFIKGDVCETLKKSENISKNISILRLDTDWYDSTKMELEVLYPKLNVGGVLIVDDYGHWAGARKAVDEFFLERKDKPLLQYTDYTGRMGVKVKASTDVALQIGFVA